MNHISENKTVLAFMAHPDDAEIFAGGTLVRLHQLGFHIHIATVSAGDCGTMTQTTQEISAIRTAEAMRAAAIIKAHYHCLDERDLRVVFDKPTIQKSIDLMRKIAPGIVITHPRIDYMMDHEVVSQLARAASFGYGAPNASILPRLDQSTVPYLYYCDPPDAMDIYGVDVQPTTIIDITQQLETKLEMLACHESQRNWLREHHGMDEYLDAVRHAAENRGKLVDKSAAEAFVQHRGHSYPADDVLSSLLS